MIATLSLATPAHAATARTAQVATSVSSITVRSGDTLIRLAARYCGHGSAYMALAAGNGIRNPNLIYVGQRLRLTCSGAHTSARASRSAVRLPVASSRIRTVINFAMAQIGKPYRWAAAGPWAYDCSGLVMASYLRIGVHLPHQTGAMLSHGRRVSRSQLRPGDIVWLSASHVGLYIGGGKVVVAPQPGERVKTQTIYAFFTARRILA
jgi:cell wall-associated NlpC family hydrolase